MRSLLIFFMLFASTMAFAQPGKGINFRKQSYWKDLKTGKSDSDKFTFVYFYDSKCNHCRFMEKEVFAKESVGQFINKNFDSFAISADSSNIDSIIGNQSSRIAASLPAYVFFDKNGVIVHRESNHDVVSFDPQDFLNMASDALDPGKQYYTLLAMNDKPDSIVRELALFAKRIGDQSTADKLSDASIKRMETAFTQQNLFFIYAFLDRSADPGFSILMKDPAKANVIAGWSPGTVENKLGKIIAEEEIHKENLLKGDKPDWKLIKERITKKYNKEFATRVLLTTQTRYYKERFNWSEYVKAVAEYNKKYLKERNGVQLNSDAWDVFLHSSDKPELQNALYWSDESLKRDEKEYLPQFLDTKANLLYKLGKKSEAIALEEKAISLGDENFKKEAKSTLSKMQNNGKTWE